jgi:hypothetical protein
VLARFTVPPGIGTVYLGTLEVAVELGELEKWKGHEPRYAIVLLSVANDGERAFTLLRSRYPSVPEPKATVAMVPGPR